MSVEQLLEAVKDAKAHNNGTNQTRYWYFRFVEYFFENPKIIAMEQEPGGFEYLVILLKLYCKSLSTGGTLRVRANNMADLNVIAKMVRHDIVIVERAIEYFIKNGIIDVVGETDNYNDRYLNMDMPYVKNMTGRSSAAADQKRLKRQSNKETEEIEVHEKEKLPKPQKNRKAYGCFENVLISDEEFKELDTEYENAKVVINRLSIYKKQDINYMSGWVITKPKELAAIYEKDFFAACYEFMSERYGGEKNVISAEVHKDESGEPHMHFCFVPVAEYIPNENMIKVVRFLKENPELNNTQAAEELGIDRKTVRRYRNMRESDIKTERLSAREVLNKEELQTFHKDLQKFLDKKGIPANINSGITKEQGGNMTVEQLKMQREYLREHSKEIYRELEI